MPFQRQASVCVCVFEGNGESGFLLFFLFRYDKTVRINRLNNTRENKEYNTSGRVYVSSAKREDSDGELGVNW